MSWPLSRKTAIAAPVRRQLLSQSPKRPAASLARGAIPYHIRRAGLSGLRAEIERAERVLCRTVLFTRDQQDHVIIVCLVVAVCLGSSQFSANIILYRHGRRQYNQPTRSAPRIDLFQNLAALLKGDRPVALLVSETM